MDFPKRKQIRLPEFDYSGSGAYFVTICTQDRRCILPSPTLADIIRSERDYLEIWEYIDGNPAKWADDKYFIQ